MKGRRIWWSPLRFDSSDQYDTQFQSFHQVCALCHFGQYLCQILGHVKVVLSWTLVGALTPLFWYRHQVAMTFPPDPPDIEIIIAGYHHALVRFAQSSARIEFLAAG